MMQVPPFLRAGDRVRVVAPSGAFDRQRFELGLAALRRRRLEPVVDDRIFARQRYLAGDDEQRFTVLHEALSDPDAKAIWFARGGYGATRILPRIVGRTVTAQPKWLVGFSDATALHALWQREGIVSMHGANIDILATWSSEAQSALWGLLAGEPAPVLRGRGVAGSGVVRGPLLGGNLTVLAAMAGGGYLPSFEGAIVFIEDVGERPYRLDRSLTTLIQSGALNGVVGVAIGQLTRCEEPARATDEAPPDWSALEVLLEVIGRELNVPVVAELPIGHEPTSFPIPLGAPATLDAHAGSLVVHLGRSPS